MPIFPPIMSFYVTHHVHNDGLYSSLSVHLFYIHHLYALLFVPVIIIAPLFHSSSEILRFNTAFAIALSHNCRGFQEPTQKSAYNLNHSRVTGKMYSTYLFNPTLTNIVLNYNSSILTFSTSLLCPEAVN